MSKEVWSAHASCGRIEATRVLSRYQYPLHGRRSLEECRYLGITISPREAGSLCKIESFGEGCTVRGYWRQDIRIQLKFEPIERQSEGDTRLYRGLRGAQ